MRKLQALFSLVIALPLLCSAGYIVLSMCLVFLTVPQLPVWAQAPFLDWALASGPETHDEYPVGHPGTAIQHDGYHGPTSFKCLLPPERGYMTDTFGTLRTGGWRHQGIDYGTYFEEVNVRTPFGGKVVFAGWNGPYGGLIVIENAGVQLLLAHHSEIEAHVGQIIEAGEVVGKSGSTGNSTGIHVHMEIRQWNGEKWMVINPAETLLPGQLVPCDWHDLSIP